jgi:hypothetical protein
MRRQRCIRAQLRSIPEKVVPDRARQMSIV